MLRGVIAWFRDHGTVPRNIESILMGLPTSVGSLKPGRRGRSLQRHPRGLDSSSTTSVPKRSDTATPPTEVEDTETGMLFPVAVGCNIHLYEDQTDPLNQWIWTAAGTVTHRELHNRSTPPPHIPGHTSVRVHRTEAFNRIVYPHNGQNASSAADQLHNEDHLGRVSDEGYI